MLYCVIWTYVIIDLKGEEIDQTFYEKELEKTYQKEFRVKKAKKKKREKGICYILNGKAMITHLVDR